MRVLFDTNIVLDVLLARVPHLEASEQLLSLVDRRQLGGVLCATTVTTVHYMIAKALGHTQARRHLRELMAIFEVAPVNRDLLAQALDLDFADFEDAVLHEAGRAVGVDGIVTRNKKDFAAASLPVFDPRELLSVALATEP